MLLRKPNSWMACELIWCPVLKPRPMEISAYLAMNGSTAPSIRHTSSPTPNKALALHELACTAEISLFSGPSWNPKSKNQRKHRQFKETCEIITSENVRNSSENLVGLDEPLLQQLLLPANGIQQFDSMGCVCERDIGTIQLDQRSSLQCEGLLCERAYAKD